jgi:hypothetical protein
MRLLQSIVPTRRQPQKPQQQFLTHLLGLLLMLPGHATFRHLSRYRAYHERTFARWYARDFALGSLNQAALLCVIPPPPPQALGLDASVIPTRGQKTSGLDRCGNGRHRRTASGRESSALAWRDRTATCADCLRVAQTPSAGEAPAPETTRIDVSLAP